MKANNQNEWTMRDEVLLLSVAVLVTVAVLASVLMTLALSTIHVSASPALSLYLSLYAATIIISFALVLYIARKATVYEGEGK